MVPVSRDTGRAGRPSPPPPAVLHGPWETLEGAEILDELRGPLGALLWQTLQDVHLWAGTPPAERHGLFAGGAMQRRMAMLWAVPAEPELKALLTDLAGLPGDPAAARPGDVAAACRLLAGWAEERGVIGTALAFAQAAALAHPADAAAALETALLALRRGEEARGESWLRRAVGLARRSRDCATYARADLELGRLYARRGAPLPALRFYLFALRRARRSGLRETAKAALNALLDLVHQVGAPAHEETLVGAALRACGASHPHAPELLRRWVRLRLARDPSAPLLEADAPVPPRGPATARAYLLAVLAREAAGADAAESFERAWSAAWQILESSPADARGGLLARALLELAHAAADAGRWPWAEYAGQRALEIAMQLDDAELRAEVERFLAALWGRTGGMGWIGHPHGPREGE